MWPLRSIAFFLSFLFAGAATFVNPIWGVVNYMAVYQANPAVTWWGKPVMALGMRFSLLAVIFTVLAVILSRRNVPKVRPWLSMWEVGAVLLVAIAGLNLALGISRDTISWFQFEKLWKVLFFVLILARLTSVRRNLKIVLWTLVLGSLYIGYDAYTAPPSAFIQGRLERVGGPDFSTTSGAAAHLGAMLPLIGTAFLISKRWRWKMVAAVSGAFTFNAVILCRTRSAFVGMAIGILAALLVAPRVRRYRIHVLLVFGALATFSLTDDHFWERMSTMTSREKLDADAAAVSRKEIWNASFRMLADHPFGIGPGNFTKLIGSYDSRHHRRATHNSLVVCFVELGCQGGILYLSMIGGSFWFLRRSSMLAHLSDEPVETKIIAYGFFVSLVTYLVTALGTQRFYCESLWWVLVLPLCLFRVVNGEVADREDFVEAVEDEDSTEPDSIIPESVAPAVPFGI